MKAAPLTPEQLAAAPGLAEGLRGIFTGLAALIARAFLRDPVHVGLILPLWNRLTRAARRFDRLMARLPLAPPRARKPGPGPGRAGGRPPVRLPSRKAWLLAALRHEAALYHNRLDRLLAAPEVAAIIAATPQAQRILRPLCHMLGVSHPALARPARLRPPTPPTPGREPGVPRSGTKPACDAAAAPARHAEPPRPLWETAPCEHVLWPWFPRDSAVIRR